MKNKVDKLANEYAFAAMRTLNGASPVTRRDFVAGWEACEKECVPKLKRRITRLRSILEMYSRAMPDNGIHVITRTKPNPLGESEIQEEQVCISGYPARVALEEDEM